MNKTTVYKLDMLISIDEYLELKNGIAKNHFHIRHSFEREYELMDIGKVVIKLEYSNNSNIDVELIVDYDSKKYSFKAKSISSIMGIYRLDFHYKNKKKSILLNFNKEFGTIYYNTINEFNISELNIFNWKSKKMCVVDIVDYIEYYDFGNIRNLILCGYLIYKFFLREEVHDVHITELRKHFTNKLNMLGMVIEDFVAVTHDIDHEVNRVQKGEVLEPYNLAFLIIALIESYETFSSTSLNYINGDVLYEIISNTLKKYDNINNL